MSSSQSSKLPGLKPPSKLPKSGAAGGRGLGSASSSRAQSPEPQAVAPSADKGTVVDDFIIGERVYVGGTKPGIIAFLGEAQFAAGQWAGIILDDLSGKNDGSVQGVRYFQCESGRGIFSRPAKLTRQLVVASATALDPLPAPTAAAAAAMPLPPAQAVAVSPAATLPSAQLAAQSGGSITAAAAAKERGLPSKNGTLGSSTSSLSGASAVEGAASSASAQQPGSAVSHHVAVGDRVLVNGTKPGFLRYLGTAEFAPGEWAGVELDDPQGKNDGSVAGKRYFNCSPMHGLFAPAHKVTKEKEAGSPVPPVATSQRFTTPVRPAATAGGAGPAGGTGTGRHAPGVGITSTSTKMRSMSRESLTSVGSAASSSVSRSRAASSKPTLSGAASRKAGPSASSSSAPSSASSGTTTALQKALKEKEEHIEQLLRERDLERSDVARAAAQVDEVESQLASVRAENDRLQYDMKETVQLLNEKVTELEMERNGALLQVDELRRRIEDLQFQIEEDAISKNDMEEAKGEEEEMLKALRLEVEREKSARHLAVEELHAVKDQLLAERQKVIASEQSAIKYLEQIEEHTNKLTVQELKFSSTMEQQQHQIEGLQRDIERLHGEKQAAAKNNALASSDTSAQLQQKDALIADLEQSLRELKKQIDSMQHQEAFLNEKVQDLQIQLESRSREMDGLLSQTQKNKCDMQDVARQLAASEAKCLSLTDEKSKLELAMNEIVKNSGDSSKQLSLLNNQLREKDRHIAEAQDQLRASEQRLARALDEIESTQEQHGRDREAAKAQHAGQLKDLNDKLARLHSDLAAAEKDADEVKKRHLSELAAVNGSWEMRLDEEKREHATRLLEASVAACLPLEERCARLQQHADDEARLRGEAEQRAERFGASTAELHRRLEVAEASHAATASAAAEAQEQLRFELAELASQLETQRAVACSEADALRHVHDETRERLDFELAEVRAMLDAERAAASELRARAERLRGSADEVRERLEFEVMEARAALEAERVQLASDRSRIERELLSTVDARDRLDFELAELRATLDGERVASEERRAHLEVQLRAAVDARERLDFEATEARSQLESERAMLRQQLQEERARSESSLRAATEARDRLEFEAMEARSQLESECAALRHGLDEVRTRLEAEVRAAVEARDKLEFEIVEARSLLDAERAELARRLQQVAEAAAAAGSIAEREELQQRELAAARATAAELHTQLEVARAAAEDSRKHSDLELADLRDRLESARCAAAELKEQREFDVAELRGQLESARLAAVDLRGQLEASRASLADSKEQHEFEVTELRGQLEAARTAALSDAAGKEKLVLAEAERLRGEMRIMQSLVQKLETEKAMLSNDHETMVFEKEECELKYSDKCKEAVALTSAVAACKRDASTLMENNTKLHDDLQIAAANFDALMQQNVALTKEKMLADELVKEKAMQIEMLQEQLQKIQADVQTMKASAESQADSRHSSDKEVENLSQELLASTKTLEVVQDQLRQALEDQQSLAQQLAASRSSSVNHSTQLEQTNNQLALENAELLARIKAAEQLHSSDRTRLAGEVDAAKRTAHAMESEVQHLSASVKTLHAENQALTSLKASADSLEKDKRRLEAEISDLRSRIPSTTVHAAGDSANQEDDIDLKCQVNFLNSVIVDLQQKNEELKRQVELLAVGENGQTDADSSYYGTPAQPGARPPRLFCDICDVFDAHDTDDCPQQASSDSPPPSHHGGTRNAPDRPYCNVCEVFGHLAEDCDDEQTF